MSFLADPPLLYVTGRAAGGRVPFKALAPPVLAVFWLTGAGFYRNAGWTRPFMRFLPGRDGRDFMWTSGILPIEHDKRRRRRRFDRMALAAFATYPLYLWLGTLGRR